MRGRGSDAQSTPSSQAAADPGLAGGGGGNLGSAVITCLTHCGAGWQVWGKRPPPPGAPEPRIFQLETHYPPLGPPNLHWPGDLQPAAQGSGARPGGGTHHFCPHPLTRVSHGAPGCKGSGYCQTKAAALVSSSRCLPHRNGPLLPRSIAGQRVPPQSLMMVVTCKP